MFEKCLETRERIFWKKKREKKKEKQKTMNEHGIGNVSIVFVSETEKSW